MEASLQTGPVVLWLGWGLVPGSQVGGPLCEERSWLGRSLLPQPVFLFVLALRTLLPSILKSELMFITLPSCPDLSVAS